MVDAISIALSGLKAQQQRLAVSASNVANASTGGAVPQAASSDPASTDASTVFRALEVHLSPQALADGRGVGVNAVVTEKDQPYTLSYDPSSAYANAEGMIAVPNVDLTEEVVNIIETKTAFKANVAVLKTQDEMLGELLDTLA